MKTRNKLGKYYRNNRDKMLSYQNNYNEENRGYVYMMNANRKAHKKYGTPINTDPDQLLDMADKYQDAINRTKETGMKYVVDHIIPLCKGGLHVPSNLQIITAKENISKYWNSDRHIPDPTKNIHIENLNIYITTEEYLKKLTKENEQ
jgi:hypothetical protein